MTITHRKRNDAYAPTNMSGERMQDSFLKGKTAQIFDADYAAQLISHRMD
jgi:hypothetical protein